MLPTLLFITALAAIVSAFYTSLGITFDEGAILPKLALPYGTWRASNYDIDNDIYTFANIRFAAPPVGDLRWRKPAAPVYNSTLHDGSYGPKCIQIPNQVSNILGPTDDTEIGAAVNHFFGFVPFTVSGGGDEDCLFLDLYVPGKAIRNGTHAPLPVLVWIYGGAYIYGSKDMSKPLLQFYDGSGLIKASGGNMIFVTLNYRVGAFGWLAGTSMEKDGLPNAGLWDQKAAFDWVQSYISLVGGDPTQVTAMGESAGAGSIMNQLVAEGGNATPTFSKVILQSAAYQPLWDRKGKLEDTFQSFATFANCSGEGLSCLRAASSKTLVTANLNLIANTTGETFLFGPAVDGSYIRQLAVLEFASGNFHAPDSLIISHVANESLTFIDGSIKTDADFNALIDVTFPSYAKEAGVNALVEDFYPPVDTNDTYATETDRMIAYFRDFGFTTNVRVLTEAMGDSKVWNMQYSVSPGWHATDVVATFYVTATGRGFTFEEMFFSVVPEFKDIAETYQSYFASFIVHGDPNIAAGGRHSIPATVWDHPDSSGEDILYVLNIGDTNFTSISDDQVQKSPTEFWVNIAAAVTNLGGYAPPGAVVNQTLVPVPNDPSANY